jgi:hypothetical protein
VSKPTGPSHHSSFHDTTLSGGPFRARVGTAGADGCEPAEAPDLPARAGVGPCVEPPDDREMRHAVASYEVQGRRTERDANGKPREVVRLDTAQSTAVAFAIAEAMVAENLTVWVFEARPRVGTSPSYRLLRIVGA